MMAEREGRMGGGGVWGGGEGKGGLGLRETGVDAGGCCK